jgi:hypothetical protein
LLTLSYVGDARTVIGGMNFLVMAPGPKGADEYNSHEAANVP